MDPIKLIRSTAKSTQIANSDNNISSNCLAISFYNQSTDSRDPLTGEQTGYIMIVDRAYYLKPGQSTSFNAPSGFFLASGHSVAFKAQTSTPGGDIPQGVISRIETEITN